MKRIVGAALCALLVHAATLGVNAPRAAPGPFTLSAPANGATGLTLTPSFSWTDSADETFYNFQISTEPGFSSGLLLSANLGQNVVTYDLPADYLTANVTYFWKVDAYDGVGNTTATNAPFSFTTGPFPPSAFTLSGPANGSGSVSVNTTLYWAHSSGETGYLVEIDTEAAFAVPVTHTGNVAADNASYYVPGGALTTGTQYFWRVTATSAAGPTVASNAPFSFTTNTPPTAPTLSMPADLATGVTLTPTLAWADSANEDFYRIEISTDASFATGGLLYQVVAAGTTSFPVPAGPLGANTTYFWRVTASNNVGDVPASNGPFRFTTGPFAPTPFTLSSPADAAPGLGLQPQLFWTDAGGETGYTLEVDTENTFTLPLIYTTSLGQDFTSHFIPPTFLSAGIQYFWRVIATNGAGGTTASNAPFSFTTNSLPTGFTLTSPVNSATGVSLTPLLQWTDASNETDYQVQVSTEGTFSTGLVYSTFVAANAVSLNVPAGPLLPSTSYVWRVIAGNNAGTLVALNAPFSFTTASVPPTAFSLSFPADLAANLSLQPSLFWTNAGGETGYTIEIDTENTFALPLTYTTTAPSDFTSFTVSPTTLAAGTQYFWRIIATNASGGTTASNAPFSFTTGTPPTGFTLTTPANGSVGVPLLPTFQWTASSNEDNYYFELSTDVFFEVPLVNQGLAAGTTSFPCPPVITANTTYYWRVTAGNNVAQVLASNAPFSFTTGNFAPAGFTLFSPLDGTVGESLEPPLQWNDAAGETSFTIEIDTENTFALPLTHTVSLPQDAYYYYIPPAILAPGTPYFWRVIAVNGAGSTVASNAPFSFTTNTPPAAFPLSAPANGVTGQSLTPILRWSDTAGEDYYEITVSTEPTFTTGVVASATQSPDYGSYAVPGFVGLTPGTLYYWRVKAINNVAQVPASNAPFTFTTTTVVPAGFNLISPPGGATGTTLTPLLTWEDTTGEASYTLEIDTNNQFLAPLTYTVSLPVDQTSFNVPVGPLAPGTTYFWQVIAVNGFGQTVAANASYSFTTDVPPAGFNLSTPSNGASGVSLTPTLGWFNTSGETTFRVEISTDVGFGLIDHQAVLAADTTSYGVPAGPLATSTTYYWRIVAVNPVGQTIATNAPFSFTTGNLPPTAFTLVSPADASTGVSLQPLLTWTDSSGETLYTVEVDTENTFSAPLTAQVGLSAGSTSHMVNFGVLSSGTLYYWRVVATNAGGNTIASNAPFSFTTSSSPPGAFTLTLPADGATGTSLTPALLWADAAGEAGYTLEVDTDSLFNVPVTYAFGLPANSTSHSVPGGNLLANTTYFWRVTASNGAGNTVASNAPFSFTTGTPPGPFTLSGPSNGATGVATTPALTWTDATGETGYIIELDTTNTFPGPLYSNSVAANVTNFAVPGGVLSGGTQYFWRIIAFNGIGSVVASNAPFSFTTAGSDATPPLVGAVNDGSGADVDVQASVTTIQANWSGFSDPESGITGYAWAIGTAPGGISVQPFTGVGVSTSATNSSLSLSAGSTYYVTVRAANGVGLSATASSDGVIVASANNPPSAPAPAGLTQLTNSLVSIPVGNLTNETLVKCRAVVSDPDGDATRLEIEFLSTAAAFSGVPTHSSALAPGGTAVVVTASGLGNGTWHWRARLVDASGAASAWTSFGGNADGAADVQVSVPVTPPLSPSALASSVAGTSSSVTLQATLVDPGDTIQLQVEVEPNPGTFGGVPDAVSPFVTSGGSGTVLLAGLAAGNYFWQARAVDAAGNASAWVAGPGFSVAANTPPAAPSSPGAFKAGGASAVPLTNETLVVFQADVSDPDADPVQLEVQVQPGGLVFSGSFAASGGTASVSATLAPGAHTWQVLARDIRGAASAPAAGAAFTISTSPPVISAIGAVPATGTAPFNVDFSAAISAANAVAGIGWDFDGDGAVDFSGAGSAAATRVYSEPGTYAATLRVTDVAGNTTVAAVTIRANAPPPPLSTLAADRTAGAAPLTVNFSALLANATRIVALSWDFDGDGNPDAVTAGSNAAHTYFAPGTYPARLRVLYDDATYETVPIAPAIVVTDPPGGLSTVRIVRAFADSDNDLQRGANDAILGSNLVSSLGGAALTVQAGQRLGLEGSATLAAGLEVHAWEWDFTGSGEINLGSDTSNTGTHVYETAGDYVATLHLTDRVAATGLPRARASASVNVKVLPPTADNPRVFFSQPAYRGRTIGGNGFTFEVTAVPDTAIDYPTVRVQHSTAPGGPWTDIPVSSVALGRPAVRLTVNLTSLIPGTLTPGTPRYWRCRVTTLGGAPVTINSDDAGQQGPFLLVPVASGAQISSGSQLTTLELDPAVRNEAAAPGKTRVVIPFEGLPPAPTPADALRVILETLDANPAGTSASVADGIDCTMAFVSGFREVKVTDGSGNEFSLLKPARVRIYYNDADDDGFLDGTRQNELDLRIFRFVNGRWSELEDAVRHPGENWIEGTTPGFSFFSAGAENLSGGGQVLGERGDHCSASAALPRTPPILPAALGGLLLAGAWAARRRRGRGILACLLTLAAASGSVFAQEPGKQEAIEQEKRKALGAGDRGESSGEELLYEYGAWSRSAYYTYRRGDGREIGWFDEDIRLWLDLGYLESHRVYLRAREEVLLYSGDDDPEGGQDTQGGRPHMDLAFYEAGNAALRARAGRQYIGLGVGFVYNQVGDGLSAEARLDPFRLSAFGARSVLSQDDIDRSRPDFDDSRRYFAGGQLDIDLLGDHKPYVVAMVQRDHNGDERAAQDFTFDSEYLGAGIAGQFGTFITYAAEGVLETGSRFASGRADEPEKIRAMAFLARGSLFLKEDSSLVLRGEYIFGSGDGDRASAVNTVNGNAAGTDDLSFLGFGYLFTGLALSPRPVNLHILHGGFAATLRTDEAGATVVDAGIDGFVFRKHHEDGGIDDPFAGPFSGFVSRDVGEEIDLYLNWKALSDLGFTIRYGAFMPGLAYKSSDPYRYYFGIGMVYSF